MRIISLILAFSFSFTIQALAQTKSQALANGLLGPVSKIRTRRAIIKCQQNECTEGESHGSIYEEYDVNGRLLGSNTTLFDHDNPMHAVGSYPFRDDYGAVEKPRFAEDGSLVGRDTCIYNSGLKQSELITYRGDGSVDARRVYLFNFEGRLAEQITYDSDQQVHTRTVYGRDQRGNETEVATYKGDGSVESIVLFEYEFDDVGNWTRKVMSIRRVKNLHFSVEPIAAFYRTITYY